MARGRAGGAISGRGIVVAFLLVASTAQAQRQLSDFTYADSLTATLFARQRWLALDSAGRTALRQGTDYPTLRRRLGYAQQQLGRPAAAARQYEAALRANAYDTLARYGLAWAWRSLNRPDQVTYYAAGLPDSLRRALHATAPRLLTSAELELSGQQNTSPQRGNAGYARLGIGTRLSHQLELTLNASYFGQTAEVLSGDGRRLETYRIRQADYHALAGLTLSGRWRAKAAYHYVHSYFGSSLYGGHLAYAALQYSRPWWTAQAGAYAGALTDTTRQQADLRLTVYPLGSLRLYAFGRGSVVFSGGRRYPNALLGAGGQLRPWLWAEVFGSTGRVPVLAEADGTYVYNLLDPLRRRAGATLHVLLPHALAWRLTYGLEQRTLFRTPLTYELYSLTSTFVWTW